MSILQSLIRRINRAGLILDRDGRTASSKLK